MTNSKEWIEVLELASKVDTKAARHLGRIVPLTPETDLVDDLALIGDDAQEFMDAFATKFDLTTGDFAFDDYFDSEGLWLLSFRKPKPRLHLTLGMLVLAAQAGTWQTDRLQDAYAQKRYA